MTRYETIGFWFNERAPGAYPRPQALVGGWDAGARAHVIAYLRDGTEMAAYFGPSHCRFGCQGPLGHRDLGDGIWVWPEGLAHYVEAHDVRLPERFVARAAEREGVVGEVSKAEAMRYDDGPWIAWATAQGACLDLDGWEVPGAADRAKIGEALGFAADVVLARADTRQVVIAQRGGAIEIRQLLPGGHAPRTLASWADWPARR